MKDLIFISAQPHDLYFVWQIEVQIVNFRKFGISDKMYVLVWYPDKNFPDKVDLNPWLQIANKYPEVKFAFIKDKGLTVEEFKLYIPQLRPQILARFFEMYPDLSKKVLFYHDSDIIFNRLPDFEKLLADNINWQSDTSHYLDYQYLRRKEKQGNIPDNEAVQVLADIGGVSIETFKSYEGKTGGAQYLIKGADSSFWRDVEEQVIKIRKAFTYGQPNSINTKYFKSENEGFQSWCADMWAVNMAMWKRNMITDITPELDFSWATDSAETYLKKPIFHNAGATVASHGIFYKGNWMNKSPIGLRHAVKQDSASWYYVKAIEEVK